jgi:signal transduction histidine kinase/CheY-like chemotaxis protein
MANLDAFYAVRLAQIENDWESQSRDLRVRIEYSRLLEQGTDGIVALQAFMTVQGMDRRFQHMIVQSIHGDRLFATGELNLLKSSPLANNLNSGFYFDADNHAVYRVFQSPIWLGAPQGNGRIAVFFKISNAVLLQMGTPGIKLSALYNHQVFASSEGMAGLESGHANMSGVRSLPWVAGAKAAEGAEGAGGAAELQIDAPIDALFSTTELVVGAAVIPLFDGLVLWFTIGLWLLRQARRVSHLGLAVRQFGRTQTVTPEFRDALTLAQGRYIDEITQVATAMLDLAELTHESSARLEEHRNELNTLVAVRTQELERARDAAESANRAKSSFLANISHEIRTPLNAVIGMAHLLERESLAPQQQDRVQRIHTAAQHLLRLLDQVLDLARIETGKLTLHDQAFSLDDVVKNVVAMFTDLAQSSGLELNVDVAPLDCVLMGDPVRLSEALLNYLGNAFKFTERGSVSLRARIDEETEHEVRIRFEVQDTGIGIPTVTVPRLFQAFEQADNSSARHFGGSGLGLAITRQLARLMGGDAGVDSKPGVGSNFWFSARFTKGEVSTENSPAALAMDDPARCIASEFAGAKVLVAEDDPVNCIIAEEFLRQVGLDVYTAHNGMDAVQMATQHAFAVILMDMQMPVMDGLQATLAIRAQANGATIPIIAMTANAFAEDRKKCMASGMNDFISKPVEPRVLFSVLLRWLARDASQPSRHPLLERP